MNRRIPILSGSIIILLTLFYINFFHETIHGQFFNSDESNSDESNSLNRTLGFENIYVINLAYRMDRRVKMEAIAYALGLDFEIFPAVSREDVDILNKYDFDIAPNHKTCYVSHYRVYESIVHNGYSGALILEDDIDIEMNIKSIMQDVYSVLPVDWEMLFIGHCWEGNGRLIANISDFKLIKSTYPACTHAYAVSLLGAKKLVKELVDPSMPIDLELREKVSSGIVTAYSLEPSAIVQWKSKDNPSDISPGSDQWTYPLKNSTLHFLGYKEV